jgi:hypothetical protein
VRFLALCCLVALVAGCSSGSSHHDRSVLAAGLRDPLRQAVVVVRPKQARFRATIAREQWRGNLLEAAHAHPRQRFASPGRDLLLKRLQGEAGRHQFEIVSVKLPRLPQPAPMVVVQTTHYVTLARAAYSILAALDPGAMCGQPGYEGIYLEAQDEYGVPFFSVDTVADPVPEDVAQGQWARSDPLKAALQAVSSSPPPRASSSATTECPRTM